MDGESELEYLSVGDVLTIHEVIVETNEDTEPGLSNRGAVEYVVEFVREGHAGNGPTTIHEKAFQLLRLLVANHPFVDGNKRTALAATVTFYALNGYDLDYGRELKTLLKDLATDESVVDEQEAVEYLTSNTVDLPEEYERTYHLWRTRIEHEDDDEDNNYAEGDPTR